MSEVKLTGIGRLLDREHENAPIALPIPEEKFNDPTFIPRLSFRHTPRVPTDWQNLTAHLAQHRDHALFIDTSIANADPEWWGAALSEPGRIHLTGRVLRELIPYMQRHPDHPLREAVAMRDPALVLVPDPADDSPSKVSLDYYLYLLSRRRLWLVVRLERFERENGRPPTPVEREAILMELQRWAGERTLRLNLKPISPYQTDEALAFHAVAHAVRTGQRTKIISGDSDVEEQFYTMVRLLTMHYYAMLLGRRYADAFTAFRPQVIPRRLLSKYERFYEQYGAALIDLGGKGIHDYIPRQVTFVPVSCVTMGAEYTSEVTYGAETAMAGVLDVKDATRGLSTDRLAGRDVRPWGVPGDIGDLLPERPSAIIGFEKTISLPGSRARVAHLDVASTCWPGDPHVRVERLQEPKPPPQSSRLLIPRQGNLRLFRPPTHTPPLP